MATVHANKILTRFMLLLGGHNHCVKVLSDSETVRGMGLWEFSGALRELMLILLKISPWGNSSHGEKFPNGKAQNSTEIYFSPNPRRDFNLCCGIFSRS